MKQKRILFLGAAAQQLPPIKYAKEQGYYVITCDYLPDNPGHKLADEWHNVSTTDLGAVLELAKRIDIDGLVAYASDPAAPTQAYVAEQLGLPGNPYSSVEILARKDLFRSFLKEHGFNVPKSLSFKTAASAKDWLNEVDFPVFVKPVDSSGSKGVTEVLTRADFESAFEYALGFSREKLVVVEEKIVRQSYQVAGDGFVVDGKLQFYCWADEHFDKLCNGLVQIGESFPTSHSPELLEKAYSETQRLLTLLNYKSGALNFDFVFDQNGNFYFLELGPRNGGCLIPEVIRYATDVDLIKYTVDNALGIDCSHLQQKVAGGFWSSYMIHSLTPGVFAGLDISQKLQNKIVEQDLWVQKGDQVEEYGGSNCTLGTMILRFDSMSEMAEMMDNMERYLKVDLE